MAPNPSAGRPAEGVDVLNRLTGLAGPIWRLIWKESCASYGRKAPYSVRRGGVLKRL